MSNELQKYNVLTPFMNAKGKKIKKVNKPQMHPREAEFLVAGGFLEKAPAGTESPPAGNASNENE